MTTFELVLVSILIVENILFMAVGYGQHEEVDTR